MNASPHLRSIACVVFAAWAWSLPALAQTKDPRTVGSEKNLSDLVLVRSTGGSAVVRFGNDPLEVVKVGDRLGRNRAEVIEIERKRLVLEERFTGRDGAPNRAQIVLRDGERGGTRYYERLDETPPPSRRPVTPADGETKSIAKPKESPKQ
jgi:hypothetical protein